MRFKQLSVDAEYTLQTLSYTYDAVSRVLGADYYPGENTASTPAQTFAYGYDVAGNLTDNNGTARTFNKLNQISSGGVTYDANGNMTHDGTNVYTWDRANRMLDGGGISYQYDGLGNRVEQRTGPKASPFTTRYLLDVQPGLVQVIRAIATTGFPLPDIQHYVHAPGGMRMASSTIEFWTSLLPDGLNSVRSEVRDSFIVDASGGYEPYGVPADVVGTFEQPFRFTGEMRDANALQYHRARYYAPAQGVWTRLDPFEGTMNRAQSLNGYSWVEGNVSSRIDPTGRYWWGVAGIPRPDEYAGQYRTDNYISHAIQLMLSEAPGLNELFHAEYVVNKYEGTQTARPVDLLRADDLVHSVEVWEIKPNNANARSQGREQIDWIENFTQGVVADPSRRGRYTSSAYPHPFRDGFKYNWSTYNWRKGTTFPSKIYVGAVIPTTTRWYAGQTEPGLIVYWKQDQQEPDARSYPGTQIRSIPKDVSDARAGTAHPPANVIPFPGIYEQPEQDAAAAISLKFEDVLLGIGIVGAICIAGAVIVFTPIDELIIIGGGAASVVGGG
ncbi:MAG: RHS repeat-associated core domain-containing protein [Chloroflexi bacterium]|nr:RHS repeat-associated core domain-containing protein [Chloroflexota bacterium]